MELIENLLQLLTTFVGALLSGIAYRKSRDRRIFCCCASTAALPSARSTGRCICCCSIPRRASFMCRSSAGWPASSSCAFCRPRSPTDERAFRCRRAWLAPAFGVPLLAFYCTFGDILSNLIWCGMMIGSPYCAIRGWYTPMGRRARRGICGTSTSACCALRSRVSALDGGLLLAEHLPASPTFWCDMLLTLAILGLLPATRKAVDA